jgi:glutamate 5-kinase
MSQAVASVGQIHLINEFQKIFEKNKIKIGQILITPDDTEQRRRALNARRTFENLFKLGAVPIVNENDTTATSEIKYGDNDRLAARVAQIIGADLLIILSDVNGLYRTVSNKKSLIKKVEKIDNNIFSLVNKKFNTYGSGGMQTKLEAAKICMNSGCNMMIANGNNLNPIDQIIKKKLFTWFVPKISNLDARKKWIISSLSSSAKIHIDQGASKALKSGKSLLPSGIVKVSGTFKKGDNILIVDNNDVDIARALSSFTSSEIDKIKGLQSDQIENILGYSSKSEILHKDDIVIL